MKKVIKILTIIFIVAVANSCKRRLDPMDYMKYVQDKNNGLRKSVEIDKWVYSIQYKPYDFIINAETKGNGKMPGKSKRIEQLKGTAWFNLSIRRADGKVSPMRYDLSDRSDYDARLNYFLNDASKDLVLIYNKLDTLYPMSYEFENNYNLTPQETMLVGFALPNGVEKPEKAMQLCFNDRIFRNGIIKATFSEKDINNIPGITN